MLGKNWWHVKENKASIWNNFLKTKYGTDFENWINLRGGGRKSTFISNMSFLKSNLSTAGLFDNNNYYWQANKGDRVLFWEDTWVRDKPLAIIFPRLYRIYNYKNKYIIDILSIWDNKETENEFWSRNLYTQEEAEARYIYSILQNFIHSPTEDILKWKINDKTYTTADMYLNIQKSNQTRNITSSRWAFPWNLKVPPKIKIFLWKISHNILPTNEMLYTRLHNTNIDITCRICNNAVENITHIFRDCTTATHCWKHLLKWWEVAFIPPSMEDWLWKAFTTANHTPYKDNWQTTLSAMLWTLWLNRNEEIFNDKTSTLEQLQYLIKHRSFEWCHSADILHINSERDWNSNPIKTTAEMRIYKMKELLDNWDAYAFSDGSWIKVGDHNRAGV